MPLRPEELARYSRQTRLPAIGLAGQETLTRARVLVIGLGGLGSPASLYLAAAGVGTLGLADFDQVETHNLQRQILHGDADAGRPKLDSAAESLHAINGSLRVEPHPEGITPDNARRLIEGYDLVVDGSDNFPTRYLVNDACYFTGKPLVYGSVFQFEGQVSLFEPRAGGPCYRCLFPEMPAPGTVPNCEEAGVFGALCGVIGSYQALEAIKRLTGAGDPLRGRLFVADTLAMRHRMLNLKPDPACPLCGHQPAITAIDPANYQWACDASASTNEVNDMEINVHQARELLRSPHPPALLDVREDDEVAICKIDGAQVVSLRSLPERWAELDANREWLVYCHHGRRSLRATEFLRAKGLNRVTSVQGGIDAWAREIEPGMARY